jgi:general secretion pathway protein D
VSENNTRNYSTLPGLSNIPILRYIFGNGDIERNQTDIVMIVTPHILRSHELTANDLKPLYIGTGQNLGGGTPPALISPDVPIRQPSTVPPGVPVPSTGSSTTAAPPPAGAPPAPASSTPPASRVVPIEAVPNTPAPPPPSSGPQIVVSAPSATMQLGGPAYAVPVTITGVQQIGTVTLTITYDPKILKATTVSQGTFMQQGGITTTFAPKIDEAAGRIDVPISRPATASGASGTGMLVGVSFQAIGAGSSSIAVSGVVLTTDGKAVPVQMVPATVTVR